MNIMDKFIFVGSKQKHVISLKKKKKTITLKSRKYNHLTKICNYHEIIFLNTKQFSFETFFSKMNNLEYDYVDHFKWNI